MGQRLPHLLLLSAVLGLPVACTGQPTKKETRELLTKIDDAFNAGDLEAVLANFHPSHKTLAAELEARMQNVLGLKPRLRRNSEIVGFENRHDRAIALVRVTTACPIDPSLRHVEHSFLVVGPGSKGELMVTVNGRALAAVTDNNRFSCPACNYTFGGSCGWLAVPAWPDQTGCMESLTFIALGHDLLVEVSVHVMGEALPARKAILRLLASMKDLPWLKADKHTRVRTWVPPAYAKVEVPKHLDGARCQVPLGDGNIADVHLATFGPIRYLMVVHGTQALIESQGALIQQLLKGFKLLDTKKTPDEVCRLSLHEHTGGGCIRDNVYSNPIYQLELTAPKGWQGTAFASKHLYRVRFQCPKGAGTLRCEGLSPPVGYTTWTDEKADQLFEYCCARHKLDEETGSGWKRSDCGYRWCEARSKKDDKPLRILRLARRGTMVVLMLGEARDLASLEHIRAAMSSLQLR